MDGNGAGVGDLTGFVRQLDYIVSLGVDAIWLSPI
jgi:glycosidase